MLKLIGFVFIITASSAIGFLKSRELKERPQKLLFLYKGVCELKERIKLSGGELERLKEECFSTPIDYSGLYKSDSEILDKLFCEIGLLNRESAYNRCELSAALLKQKYNEAQSRYSELSKLYKSIGVLSGIFICIFFL